MLPLHSCFTDNIPFFSSLFPLTAFLPEVRWCSPFQTNRIHTMSKRRERKVLQEFTEDQVALHSTPEDCYIIVHGVVYDATKFIQKHTGGAEAIVQCAGTDATEVFERQGHQDHSLEKLGAFKVGVLKNSDDSVQTKQKDELKKKKKESLWYQVYPFLIPLAVVTVSFVSRLWVEGWFN
jgi:cytochrome b involved in lipid metabolism